MTHLAYAANAVFTGTEILTEHAVLVRDGKIAGIVPNKKIPSGYQTADHKDCLIAPAFIDLQIYGGNGKLFSEHLDMASLESTYASCLAGGCTHFMITMATNTIENFVKGIGVVKEYIASGKKGLLGIHLEGPYLNPEKKGAHPEALIKKATLTEVKMLLAIGEGVVRMMTVAPELCPPKVLDFLLDQQVIVSAGHSNATYQQAFDSFEHGIPTATHLFNAMSPLQGRQPGLVGAIYDHPAVMASIICDGIHVDFNSVRISQEMMGERLFFITDAVAASRKGPYKHVLKKDRYTLPDGTLSGSAVNMMQSVRNAVQKAGIPLETALKMGSLYPSALLQDADLGNISKGAAADFVIVDPALAVKAVIQA